jgi:hypothetical protein
MASHIYYPKKPTTKMIVPFIRQEVDGIKTIALLQFTVTRKLSQKALLNAFIRLITKWVKETVEGRKALDYTNGDFNVGDYALHEATIHDYLPHAALKREGIVDIEILYNGETDGAELYDKVLIDQSRL